MKTERAKVHLDSLNRELTAYCKEPYTVVRWNDLQNSRSFRKSQLKPLNHIIGMLLGEFLYCLRSGLDQLAWSFALPAAQKKNSNVICFPIFESVQRGEDRRNFAKALAWFPPEIAHEIEALQPHKGIGPPQDHPLWQLNKLCNIDKHCVIPINSRTIPIFVPNNPAVLLRHYPLEDAIEVSVPIQDKDQLDIEPDSSFFIEFGEWDSDFRIPQHRLTDIHGFFESSVLPRFKKFGLDKPDPRLRIEFQGVTRDATYSK
jgi:hypothetical protein